MENEIIVGSKKFKNSEEFNDYASDKFTEFLENITNFSEYTYPADGNSLFEEEEGISFYYTNKGMVLVRRWKARMQKIFDKYFPESYPEFEVSSTYFKEF